MQPNGTVIKRLLLVATHGVALAVGFALGIYFLPILIAPPAPSDEAVKVAVEAAVKTDGASALFTAQFRRDLKDSDALHWGEGAVTVSARRISLTGRLAPGPDYKLYLSPEFVETEADFERLKSTMARVGDIKTFNNFIVDVPSSIDVNQYRAVIVWCETFRQFISAAQYR